MCPSELLVRELQRKYPDRRVGIIQANINMIKERHVRLWSALSVNCGFKYQVERVSRLLRYMVFILLIFH